MTSPKGSASVRSCGKFLSFKSKFYLVEEISFGRTPLFFQENPFIQPIEKNYMRQYNNIKHHINNNIKNYTYATTIISI